jgi:CRP/FNR family transcriptional regulator, cyclic AMP receptor protein
MQTLEVVAYGAAFVAGCLVCVSFFMKTIIPLRVVAIGSNVGFIAFGVITKTWPILALHGVLLPINIYRLGQMFRLTRRVEAAAAGGGDPTDVWLRPYMTTRKLAAGTTLFRKGDPATEIFYLAEGRIEFVEIGEDLPPGKIFGEIAFFTEQRLRTMTARCREKSTVLAIDEATLKQLYYQNPEFGFYLVRLVAQRLAKNVERLELQLARHAV